MSDIKSNDHGSAQSGAHGNVKAVKSMGSSVSWTSRQTQACKRWEEWRKYDNLYDSPVEWDKIPEEELCTHEMYERFAGMLFSRGSRIQIHW